MNCMIGLIIVVLIVEAKSADLSSHFKICSHHSPTFTDCISTAVVDAVASMAQGLKSFNILPLEPLEIESMSIGDTGGSVSIKHNYKNAKFYGITKGLKVHYDPIGADMLVFRSNTYNDQIEFVADYNLEGRVLLLPIAGNGRSNVTMVGLNSRNTMHCETYEKNGEKYLRVKKYEVKFSPEKVIFHFTNLIFNDEPVLTEQMNKFLNANSEIVFNESKKPFEETFGLILAKIANDVFSHIPMNKLFPE